MLFINTSFPELIQVSRNVFFICFLCETFCFLKETFCFAQETKCFSDLISNEMC